MKALARILIRLYPRTWRARYGEEFQALLEDSPPTLSSLFDLLKGALQMQFSRLTFLKLTAILSVAGLALGFAASFLITPRYSSTATMMLTPTGPEATRHVSLAGFYMRMESGVLSRTSLFRIIQHPRLDLYKTERAKEPLEDVIQSMKHKSLRVTPITRPGISNNDTLVFQIRFDYSSAQKAQAVVQTLITNFQDENLLLQQRGSGHQAVTENDRVSELEARIAILERKLGMRAEIPHEHRIVSGFNLDVLDPPTYPEEPAAPNRYFFSAWGFGSGFTLAIFISIFRRRIPPPAVALPA